MRLVSCLTEMRTRRTLIRLSKWGRRLMRFHLAVFIFAASLGATGLAHSAALDITNAKVAAGLLQVTGTSPQPNQNVQLDSQFTVMSDANNNFAFSLNSY